MPCIPALLDGSSWRFLQCSPHLNYLFTRRHLQVDKTRTACSDQLREAQPAAHSSDRGPVNPWDNPIKTSVTFWSPLLFKEQWWSASWAAIFTKLGHHSTEINFIAFGKSFSTATSDCLHFCWQIPCCFLDGVATTFSVDSVKFLPYFSAVLTTLPSKRLVCSFSFCLFTKLLLSTGGRSVFAVSHGYYFLLLLLPVALTHSL